jgi:hypothetical protein
MPTLQLTRQNFRAEALAPLAMVALLAAYCQIWSLFGESVTVAISLQWALINTAALLAFVAPLWIMRLRLLQWAEDLRPGHLTIIASLVLGAMAGSILLSTAITGALWGQGVELARLARRLVALAPFMLAVTIAVTAMMVLLRWRTLKSAQHLPAQLPREGWIDFPEAPLLQLRTSDMAVIRTARNYCEFEVAGHTVLVRVTAKQLEQRLAPHGFARVHRGAIVNLARVRVVQRARSGRLRLLLDDGSEIAVSKGHRDLFARQTCGTERAPMQVGLAA